jgi:hypothetical protein
MEVDVFQNLFAGVSDRLACRLIWTLLTDRVFVTGFVALYSILLYRASLYTPSNCGRRDG